MAQPSAAYMGVIKVIDKFTEWTGPIFMLISIPLILSNVVEVAMRYVFKDPTIWALDVTTMAFGALFLLGSAYGLLKGAHVRTDMLWDKFSDQKKGVIDSCAFIFFFLPAMAILCWSSYDDFLYSMSINEKSNSGAWQPIIWPFRAVITIATGMLFLQGISELLKSIYAARTGEVLVKHEKIEV